MRPWPSAIPPRDQAAAHTPSSFAASSAPVPVPMPVAAAVAVGARAHLLQPFGERGAGIGAAQVPHFGQPFALGLEGQQVRAGEAGPVGVHRRRHQQLFDLFDVARALQQAQQRGSPHQGSRMEAGPRPGPHGVTHFIGIRISEECCASAACAALGQSTCHAKRVRHGPCSAALGTRSSRLNRDRA
jgi:hypothetical protein